ncbi:MAG: signal recognition particle-docking protein FtsY, partial [Deltaproteobacteria bacterium]|nr:signal recognition particle-docking protein FtsY [Deltaproteobacteria bacterium]
MALNWLKKKTPPNKAQKDKEELPDLQAVYFKRLRAGLSKTRKILTTDLEDLFAKKKKIDDDLLEE